MFTTDAFNFILSDYTTLKRENESLREQIRTGIKGYCHCCGAPNKINLGQQHDKECTWYDKEG